jgi:hypothetical protein
MNYLKLEKRLVHNPFKTISLGCADCPERPVCGGLQVTADLFDCTSFCPCDGEGQCQYVCRRHAESFVATVQDVRGFTFDTIARSAPLPLAELPFVVPLLYHGSRRERRLKTRAVALKLMDLVDYPSGQLKFKTKPELAEYFKFEDGAKVIISGVDQDRFIEPYWTHAHQGRIIDELYALGPELITVPNFSLFLQAPRWDNLHNMKRIALCWSELVSHGVSASLHLNARTDRDWERWTDFIGERDEVKSVALEFGTGLARKDRGQWHTEKILALAAQVKRPLHLVLRGGLRHLRELAAGFHSVSLLESSAFSRTRSRRRLEWRPGEREKWKAVPMPETECLDELLQFNVDERAAMIIHQAHH